MIDKVLDEYEVKARMAPAIILVLPVIVGCLYTAPVLSSWPVFAASGICCLVLLYGLGYVVRARGNKIEPSLWNAWGGPPSTRFLRHHDSTLPTATKAQIRVQVEKKFSIALLSADEERREPARADRAISDAFRRVRQYLRQRNPVGLWFKQNAEYGFCRNLFGCRVLLLALALASAVFTGFYGWRTGAGVLNTAASVEFSFSLCTAYYGWKILPEATKRIANAYAESAWISFLDLSEETEGLKAGGTAEILSEKSPDARAPARREGE